MVERLTIIQRLEEQQFSQLRARVRSVKMSETGVFGASKAGAKADPMAYLRKPSVVFRIGALVSGLSTVLCTVYCALCGSNKCYSAGHVIFKLKINI